MLIKIPDLIANVRENIQCISAIEAAEKCKSLNAVFIDVREPAEYAKRSVQGTINIPRGILEMQSIEKFPDENTPIFIHCATGGRACLAAEQLQRIGYQNIWAITCNLDAVIQAN